MTQQPDPFSELRGLMAEALACLPSNESDDELCTEHFFIKRASAHFQTLLDERDRLIASLREIEEAAVVDDNAYRNEATITGVGETARQALSQEIG